MNLWSSVLSRTGRHLRQLGGGFAIFLLAPVASSVAQEVIPDFYKEPGINPNRSYVNQSFNEHIDPFTGSLQLHYTDIHIPGNGRFDLSVVRSYNSASVEWMNPAAYDSLMGVGWNIHFGRVLKKDTAICATGAVSVITNPVIEMPDGSRQLLAFTGGTSPLALSTQRWRADCLGAGAGLTVYSPDGTRYDMDHLVNVSVGTATRYAWYTSKITDRNGNYATITYAANASPQISSVTTNDGRTLSFSYDDSGLSSRRITSITGAGQTYTYGYTALSGVTGKYMLTSVTRPGGTAWSYAYNTDLGGAAGGYLVNRVTYPEGGYINYTYDFVYFDTTSNPMSRSTVIKSKTLSTGGTWSFSYTPGSLNNYDTTTVSTPSGTITYRHVGPNYASAGTVWMVGLLMSKQTGSVQTETNTWTKQKISSQNNARPGAFSIKVDAGEVNAPLLSSRVVVRDGATHTTNYGGFDSYGNPTSISESGPNGGNRTTSLTYYINTSKWVVNRVKDQVVSSGVSFTRVADGNGNFTSVTRDGVTTEYAYDAQGNVTSATFPRSLTHTYSNHKRGIPQNESQPEGISLSRVVSDAGNVTSETNGELKTTSYAYDGLNRVTAVTPPAGSAVTISYSATSKTATRGSLSEQTSYDGFGRPTAITLGGIARSYQHDALGRMTFASNPASGSGTSYQYDILDRVTRTTNADGTFQSTSYGAGSKTVVDERSKSTTFSYRAYGDPETQVLMSVAAPDASANVSIARNGKDLITSMTQAGLTRVYGYNTAGHLTSVSNPETGSTVYGRDAAGNMTTRTVGSSGTTTYGYDGQNRLTSETYPSGTPAVSKTYSKTHKLKTVTSSVASRSYGYDSNDNLTTESLTVDGIPFTTTYGYNSLDQLSMVTYPRTGRVVNYSPNALGRPTQVSGFVTGISYWPSGQVNQIVYANGTTSTYGQNSRLWPSSFSTAKGSAAWVNSTYGYDGAGNLTSVSDSADAGYNRTLGYDSLNRVTAAAGPWGSGTIAYNGAGNITSQTQGSFTLTYSYDAQNRLSSVSGARAGSFTYDAYGDITAAPGATYAYDGAPNLTCVNCGDAGKKVAYTYDGLNRRVSVTKAGVKTYEVYGWNGNLLHEYTPSLLKTTDYIYLGGKRIAQAQSSSTSITTLAVAPSPAAVGQTVTLTATVNGSSPTGTVTFKDGATTLGTGTVSAGKATYSTSFSATGTHSLTASYGGDANNSASASAAASLTVNSIATSSTSLAASANPVVVGVPVSLTATVTGSSPTGTVTFNEGATVLGTASISGGVATISATFTTTGTHSLTASYGGNTGNKASVSPAFSLTVNPKATTGVALTAAPNPVGVGQSVLFTATVTGTSPSGTVTFKDGATTLGTATLNAGKVSYSTSFNASGTHSITASYGGNSTNSASNSAAVALAVNAVTTTSTALSATPNPAAINGAVNLTATVTGNSPSGTVTFKDGVATLGTASISAGKAILSTTFTTGGSHSLSAAYGGNAANTASTSSVVALNVITPAATATTWVPAAPSTATVGTTVVLKAKVAPTAGGSLSCDSAQGGCSRGSVRFMDGATVLATVPVSQDSSVAAITYVAVYAWAANTAGNHTITAQYVGTTLNLPSSTAATVNVTPAVMTATTWVPAAPTTATVGTGVELKVKVAPATGTMQSLPCDSTKGSCAYGSVRFMDGATVLATVPVSQPDALSDYGARYVWIASTVGSHNLSAQYLGTTSSAPSSASATVNVTAAAATTTTWVPPAPTMATLGTSVQLRVKVAPTAGGTLPCDSTQGCSFGSVRFMDGATVLATVPLSRESDYLPYVYVAAYIWTANTTGSHTITAQYLGTTSNAPSSTTATLNVAAAAPTTTTWVPALPATATVGTNVQFRVKVAPAAGGTLPCDSTQGCSFGSVRFMDGATVLATVPLSRESDYLPYVYVAAYIWTANTTGSHTITAQYLGTTSNAPSSTTAALNVAAAAPTTTTWAPVPSATATVGTNVGLEVKIAPTAGGTLPCDNTQGCSFGSVRFMNGATVLATVPLSRESDYLPYVYIATYIWTANTPGSHTITAQYLGTTPNAPSSATASVLVQ